MTNSWSYTTAFSRHAGLLSASEQQLLRRRRVAIVGMGGVGGIHLVTLGRLGIGRFNIADLDHFETANFNRQYGARVRVLGQPKVKVMAEEIRQINPDVQLRIFEAGVQLDTVSDFLQDVDLLVDGIDFFEIDLRRQLFRKAAQNGIHAITAAPLGFSAAWLTFDPQGMSFDEYFDIDDEQSDLEKVVAFAVGLAPEALHDPYFNWDAVDLAQRQGPSSGLACQLCAGVVGAETIKILLGREKVRCVPEFSQFDAYRGLFKMDRLETGNRHPDQQQKRALLRRRIVERLEAEAPISQTSGNGRLRTTPGLSATTS